MHLACSALSLRFSVSLNISLIVPLLELNMTPANSHRINKQIDEVRAMIN
jgi:hypothetical protein